MRKKPSHSHTHTNTPRRRSHVPKATGGNVGIAIFKKLNINDVQ